MYAIGNINGNSSIEALSIDNNTKSPSSSLDIGGTLSLKVNVSGATSTIAGQESASANTNGNTVYIATGAGVTQDTLPLASSTPNRIYFFKARGAGVLSVAVTGGDSFAPCGSSTTSTTPIAVGVNTSTAVISEYGASGLSIWDVLCNL
jgi:hypothetical protein